MAKIAGRSGGPGARCDFSGAVCVRFVAAVAETRGRTAAAVGEKPYKRVFVIERRESGDFFQRKSGAAEHAFEIFHTLDVDEFFERKSTVFVKKPRKIVGIVSEAFGNAAHFGSGCDVDAYIFADVVEQLVFFGGGILFFQQERRQHAFDARFVGTDFCKVVELRKKRDAAVRIGNTLPFGREAFASVAVKMQPVKFGRQALLIPAVNVFGRKQQHIACGQRIFYAVFLDENAAFDYENKFVRGGAYFGVRPHSLSDEQTHVGKTYACGVVDF